MYSGVPSIRWYLLLGFKRFQKCRKVIATLSILLRLLRCTVGDWLAPTVDPSLVACLPPNYSVWSLSGTGVGRRGSPAVCDPQAWHNLTGGVGLESVSHIITWLLCHVPCLHEDRCRNCRAGYGEAYQMHLSFISTPFWVGKLFTTADSSHSLPICWCKPRRGKLFYKTKVNVYSFLFSLSPKLPQVYFFAQIWNETMFHSHIVFVSL